MVACLPGLSTAGQATRQSVWGMGYSLPVPLILADHLHGIEQVDGVHDNPN